MTQHHDPNGMIALCREYHDKADAGSVGTNWAMQELEGLGEITLKKTFHFTSINVYVAPTQSKSDQEDDNGFDDDIDFGSEPVHVSLATLNCEYFKIKKGVVVNDFDIYFHESIEMEVADFVIDSDITIFSTLALSRLRSREF